MDNFEQSSKRRRRGIDGISGGTQRAGSFQGIPGAPQNRAGHVGPQAASGPARKVGDFAQKEGYHLASSVGVAAPLRSHRTSEAPIFGDGLLSEEAKNRDSRKELAGKKHGLRKLFSRRNKKLKKPKSAWRKWAFRVVIVLVLLAVLGGGFLVLKGASKVHKVFKGGGSSKALTANVDPSLLKGEGDGRVNILLLGKGGAGHDGADLTDTMLLVSIDPVNHKASLVSIPRDLWVQAPGTTSSTKINAVYALAKQRALAKNPKDTAGAETAGIAASEQIVHTVLGVNVNYFGMIDFQAFQQAVDTVGGVTINVPTELVDETMAWQNGGNPVLARVGEQTFNGKQALMYVRSRHGSARGDFDRTERQRLFIVALTQKILTAGTYTNPVKISGLLSAFGDHISTDFSVTDAVRLMGIAKNIPSSAISSIGLADPPNNYVKTGSAGNQSVVLPVAGLNNYAPIQQYIRTQLPDGYVIKEAAKVAVMGGAGKAAGAAQTVADLKTYGYIATAAGTTTAPAPAKTVLVDLSKGKKPYTKNYLQERFGVQATTALPAGVHANGADFVIIVGNDETTHS